MRRRVAPLCRQRFEPSVFVFARFVLTDSVRRALPMRHFYRLPASIRFSRVFPVRATAKLDSRRCDLIPLRRRPGRLRGQRGADQQRRKDGARGGEPTDGHPRPTAR